jgi:outer membrane protein, heavy metal efflux system
MDFVLLAFGVRANRSIFRSQSAWLRLGLALHFAIGGIFALIPPTAQAQSGSPDQLAALPSMVRFVDLAIGGQSAAIEPLPVTDEYKTVGLALPELEQIALQNNPTLSLARARIEAARGQWLQGGLYPNPTVGYSGEEMGDEGTSGKQGGVIGQEIVTAGKLRLNRAVACQEIAKLQQEAAAQQFRVLTDVRTHFYETLVDQRKIELIEQLVKIGEEGVRTAEALFQAKEASRVDLLQAQVEVDSTRILLFNARRDYEASWRMLSAVLGCPQMQMARLSGNVEDFGPMILWEDAIRRLLVESPELAAARAEVPRSRCALERACAERISNITFETSVHQDNVTDSMIAAVQLEMPLQIFNRNQGNIVTANSELIAAHRNMERVQLELQARLATIYDRYASSRGQVEQYRSSIIPNAKESLELIAVGYQQGEFGYLSLLTAQRTYFRSNLAYIEAIKELKLATAEIEGLLLKDSLAGRQ